MATIGLEIFFATISGGDEGLAWCRESAQARREELVTAGYACTPVRVVVSQIPGVGTQQFAGFTPTGVRETV